MCEFHPPQLAPHGGKVRSLATVTILLWWEINLRALRPIFTSTTVTCVLSRQQSIQFIMSDDEYTPLIDRQREPESRIHEELTRPARERLAQITENRDRDDRQRAFKETMKLIGRTPVLSCFSENRTHKFKKKVSHYEFIYQGATVPVLTYIEQLYVTYGTFKRKSVEDIETERGSISEYSVFEDIWQVLVTEGLLWEIEWAERGGVIQFTPLASEGMADMDSKVQALAENEPWSNALEGYNAAFERYLSGDFDDTLVTKLYNSIEEVLQTICVDLEGWIENRDMSHGDYLDLLNENDVYDANGITAPELNQLLDSLEKMVSKVGNDRKQRHAYHDRAYCTLLIHQVGAYLYFLISRYEDYATNSGRV